MKTNDEALLKIKYNVLRTVSRLAFEENVRVTNRATISFRLSLLHVRSVRSQDSL